MYHHQQVDSGDVNREDVIRDAALLLDHTAQQRQEEFAQEISNLNQAALEEGTGLVDETKQVDVHVDEDDDDGEKVHKRGMEMFDGMDDSGMMGPSPSKRSKMQQQHNPKLENQYQATKAWIQNTHVSLEGKLAPQVSNVKFIGVAREYSYIAYCSAFGDSALTKKVYFKICADAGLNDENAKKMTSRDRTSLSNSTILYVYPGLQLEDFPIKKERRPSVFPSIGLQQFQYTEEWRNANPIGANAIRLLFGDKLPSWDLDYIRQYYHRKRENYNNNLANTSVGSPTNSPQVLSSPSLSHIPSHQKRPSKALTIPGVDPNKIFIGVGADQLSVKVPIAEFERTSILSDTTMNWKPQILNRIPKHSLSHLPESEYHSHTISLPCLVQTERDCRKLACHQGLITITLTKMTQTNESSIANDEWEQGPMLTFRE